MDAVAETSEMALSEEEEGPDGGDIEGRQSSKVDDVVMVTLSDGARKMLGCVIGENIFVDKTWCQVPKKRILDDLTINKDASPFFPFAKEIEKYYEEEFLIGYTPFEEVQNRFLFCNTVHGKLTILRKLANLREEDMKRIMKSKFIRPGAWESYGSEKEIELANVQNERPLVSHKHLIF